MSREATNGPVWEGVFAYPVTHMDRTGEQLDLGAYREHVEFMVESGVHGVAPLGSTGEFAYLAAEERRAVVSATVDQVRGRVPIMAGASAITTSQTVRRSQEAADLGADGLVIVVQAYFPLSDEEILSHFEAIANAVNLPVFVYNNPTTSKVDIGPSLLARLAEIPTVQGVKESTGQIERITQIQRTLGKRLKIFCGQEHLAFPMFRIGVDAWAAALANIVPRLCAELYELTVKREDTAAALELHRKISPLAEFIQARPLAPAVKTALQLVGRRPGHPRRPLTPLPESDQRTLKRLLRDLEASRPGAVPYINRVTTVPVEAGPR